MKFKALILFLSLLSVTATRSQIRNQQDSTFKPSGRFSGYVFGDFAFKFHADEKKRGFQQYSGLKKNYSAFNIRRLYLQYGYQFSPPISAHITLAHESGVEANSNRTNLLADGNRTVFVKHAFIQFEEVIPRAAIVLGQQATPTFSRLSETIWGYRSIEKTVADMREISASSDLGLGVYGKIGKEQKWGYDVLYANNSGTRFISDTHKKLYTSLFGYFLDKKLVAQINYEYNKTSPLPEISGNTQLVKVFAAYKTSQTTLGLEVFRQLNKNSTQYIPFSGGADSLTATKASTGLSVFFTQTIQPEKLKLFIRTDWFNPDADFNSRRFYLNDYSLTKEIFASAGIDCEISENVHLMPNLWMNHYESKSINNAGAPQNGYDLAGRITFYYLFNK